MVVARMHALVAASLALFAVSSAEVPLDVQLPSFLKALSYDRNLASSGESLRMAVLFDPGDRESAAEKDRLLEIQKELTRLRVKGRTVVLVPVPYDSGPELLESGANVLLVAALPGAAVDALAQRGILTGRLSFTTRAADVDRGVAVGMELVDGRPRFVVNRAAAGSAGASFESGFLDLCRIVER